MDMKAVSCDPIVPTVGHRSDGAQIFYRGALNTVFGESEGGKTWFCLHQAAQIIISGKRVVMLDYEDGAQGAKVRLMQLGVPEAFINNPNLFTYLNPQAVFDDDVFESLAETFQNAEMVLIDAFSEAAALEGVDDYRSVSVAGWYTRFPRRIAALGPAVVLIDHVNKAADAKGQQTGSQHKKAGVDGISLRVSPIQQFAEGHGGASIVHIGKDRHSGVKKNAVRGEKNEPMRFAILKADEYGNWTLDPAAEPVDADSKAAAKDYILRGHVATVMADPAAERTRSGTVKKESMRKAVRALYGSCDNGDIDRAYDEVLASRKAETPSS
ncbi:hypothetical protein ASD11_12240 [Aeromicrobium sp. Root495]|nr:hypothetical protein ASD11_12240 [Aeromicrobium sp. Root495]